MYTWFKESGRTGFPQARRAAPQDFLYLFLLYTFPKSPSCRYVVPETPGQRHSVVAGLDVNPLEGWDPAKVISVTISGDQDPG